MKLHHLRLGAFGPFPDEEHIDFDALSQDGLFLLRGPTGAGKTSLLDAVTFALYGHVAGTRGTKLLKSQHAAEDAEPFVELDFSRGGSRYRIRRTAQYRKTGRASAVNSQVTLSAHGTTGWVPLTSGVQAASAEISHLLGLTMAQFTRVILLPQGEFAQFLHASSGEKRELLEKLFDTSDFRTIENSFRERSKETSESIRDEKNQIDYVKDQIIAAAQEVLNDDDAPGAPLEVAEVEDICGAVEEGIEERRIEHQHRTQLARSNKQEANEAQDVLLRRERELTAWKKAQTLRAKIDDEAPRIADIQKALRRAGVAEQLIRWLDHRDASEAAVKTAEVQSQEALARLEETYADRIGEPWEPCADATAALDQTRRRSATVLEELRSAEVQGLQEQLANHQRAVEQHTEQRDAQQRQLTAAEGRLTEIQEKLSGHREHLQDADELHENLAQVRELREAVKRKHAVAQRTEQVMRHHQQARERQADIAAEAQEQVELTRETQRGYLNGIAAELSEALIDGEPCQVCGATEHPNPQNTTDQVQDREQLERMHDALEEVRQRNQEALATVERHEQDYQRLQAELNETSLTAGLESPLAPELQEPEASELMAKLIEDLAEELARCQNAYEAAQTAQRTDQQHRRHIEELSREQSERNETRHQIQQQLLQSQNQIERATAEAARAHSALTGHLAGFDTVLERIHAVSAVLESAREAIGAAENLTGARVSYQDAENAAAQQVESSEFSSEDDIRAAVIPSEEATAYTEQVESHQRSAQALASAENSEEVRAGAVRAEAEEKLPSADELSAAAQRAEDSQTAVETAVASESAFRQRVADITRSLQALRDLLGTQESQQRHRAVLQDLSATLNGVGHDNDRKMTLSSFVLAARLEKVAEAATQHLMKMSDGRYELLHDDDLSGQGHQGLNLKVRDQHADQHRPASSLSGGETFMTSLALALGLAEVVRSESGGIDMESLFIDEGFGSLDEQSLESVMAALNTLRGEGRRIGVVSHVKDMHDQIPVQLQITKTRNGSRTAMRIPSTAH